MIKSTNCIVGCAGVEKSIPAGPVSGGDGVLSSPVKKERDVPLENEVIEDSRRLPTLPLRFRPPSASLHCAPSPSCPYCFFTDRSANGAVRAPAAAPSSVPAATAAVAEFVSALLMLGSDNSATVGNDGSPISLMPLVAALDVAEAGGSISEERINMALLPSDKDKQRLLVLLPSPLLLRRKR